jgi:hypothetical protein
MCSRTVVVHQLFVLRGIGAGEAALAVTRVYTEDVK